MIGYSFLSISLKHRKLVRSSGLLGSVLACVAVGLFVLGGLLSHLRWCRRNDSAEQVYLRYRSAVAGCLVCVAVWCDDGPLSRFGSSKGGSDGAEVLHHRGPKLGTTQGCCGMQHGEILRPSFSRSLPRALVTLSPGKKRPSEKRPRVTISLGLTSSICVPGTWNRRLFPGAGGRGCRGGGT